MRRQKIIAHLWFDKEAVEATEFYAKVFPNAKITSRTRISGTPSGDCDIVAFSIEGYEFMTISAGPYFKINPSISFILNFDPSKDKEAKKNLETLWSKLIVEGKAMMPLQKYDFSELYGWVQDKFGVSWQLMLTNPHGQERPFITPSLMFTGDVAGLAEEATNYYISVFKNSKRGLIARYPKGMPNDKEGTIMYTDYQLCGQYFASMDSAHPHGFQFNEAISFMINCKDQQEIDYYFEKLSAVKDAEQCGWVKDEYGVSWQIIPENMSELMSRNPAKTTPAMLKMKKIIISELEKAGREK